MDYAPGVMLVLYGKSWAKTETYVNPESGVSVHGLLICGKHEVVDRSLLRVFSSHEEPHFFPLDFPISFVHARENSEFTTSRSGFLTSRFGVLASLNAKINLGDASFEGLNVTAIGSSGVTGIGAARTSILSANGTSCISGFCILEELVDGGDPTASIHVFGRPGVRKRSRYTVLTIQE